jgi:5-deoxy-glucuronate isomerase
MATITRTKAGAGLRWIVKRRHGDLLLLDFGLVGMKAGDILRDGTGKEEAVFHIFGGSCSAEGDSFSVKGLGEREDVFGGRASALYIPPHTRYIITALTDLRAALFEAPAASGGPVRDIRPGDVTVRETGKGSFRRTVHEVGLSGVDAKALMWGETFVPPGNWSGFPPAKHDVEDPPRESKLEELLYFRTDPADGFGLQRTYTADGYDQVFLVGDSDLVTIPRGFHALVAAPGCALYSLWVLAAFKERRLLARPDARYALMLSGKAGHGR